MHLSQNSLSGFIERNSAIGKMEISSFSLSIKGLTTEYEQIITFNLSEWRLIVNLFKYYNDPLKIMIGNYKTSQEEIVSKRKLVKVLTRYVKHAENKLKNKKIEIKDYLNSKSISKIVKKEEQGKEEKKRYLFEIILPSISVDYLHHNINKPLNCDELEHLCNSNFSNWKLYNIRTLFRMEFSITEPIPVKLTDKYINEMKSRRNRKKLKIKQSTINKEGKNGSKKNKSDDGRSQGIETEEEDDLNRKNIVIKRNEAEKVEKAQKNIQFWFD